MKAMVLNAPREISYEEIKRSETAADETLIRITHTGICGTDLKIFQGGIPAKYPLVMGHESIGEVFQENREIPSGSRVIIDPVTFCGACYHCRAGQTHLCPKGLLIGRDRNGGFAEFLSVPSGNIHLLPEKVENREAPLIQPLTTCLHAQRRARIFPGESVIVLGLGVTGLFHIQLAKAHGAYPVIGITRSKWKRELAEKLGADLTLEPNESALKAVLDATEGRGADLVIESVGQLPVLADAISYTRLGGKLLPFGIYTEKNARLPFYELYFKELAVINARAAKPEDYPACIDLVERGVVKLQPLISHTLNLSQMGEALEMLNSNMPDRMKIIFDHVTD
ncbi:MAG: alcohol dehydrogenase catalytic domain-containing protein [SAR324 cluster bacterium]|nr:alcohol dehydrogenase catalytic domain-containing protein [SAR324 cluster bacterium]